jgi:squalene synthase HpnC
MSVGHYENFPVASWWCPPRLRPAIVALYRFARTADDIADEGDASAAQRLADLAAYRAALGRSVRGEPAGPRWREVFEPLGRAVAQFSLPPARLHDLLDAFTQDVTQHAYADRAELLDYCRRSANPVGRLLLHLYGVGDAESLARSDAICTALQLINFWQDLSIDVPRGRVYLPQGDLARFAVHPDDLRAGRDTPALRALVAAECAWARELMLQGAPLARRVPGRAGWELRLVVQGGLRVLDKIAALDHATLHARPRLRAADAPCLLWRALAM